MSAKGLPLASVSNGTNGGMFVPRRRTYRDAETAGMRIDIRRNVVPSMVDVTAFHAVAPLPLKVRRSDVDTFLAAAGTTDKPAVVPSAAIQAALRGHSPA